MTVSAERSAEPAAGPPGAASRPGPYLAVALAALLAFAAYMYWAQNFGGRLGGPISAPKALWLGYALATFYVMPAFFLADRRVAPAVRGIYFWFLLSWALRGGVELYLMYGAHDWIPPYGVYHGVFNLGLLAFLTRGWRAAPATPGDAPSRNGLAYLAVIRYTQFAEIAFATLFYYAVAFDTRTTWFAGHDSKFLFINVLTAGVEIALIPMLARTVRRYYA